MRKKNGIDLLTMPNLTIQRRQTKQDRSTTRQRQITQGAILAISRYGIAGLTHRRVAEEAHVSLAATSYYYQTKTDIVADASRALLTRYADAFHRFAVRNADRTDKIAFRKFAMKLVFNAVGKYNVEALAWCEIILNTAQEPELRNLSRSWFGALNYALGELAGLLDVPDIDQTVISSVDTVIGFLFLVMPLGLNEGELRALLAGEAHLPVDRFHVPDRDAPPVRPGKKAGETRERILGAAVDILIEEGAEALGFRRLAEKCNMSIAAPAYHFASISTLWNAAQLRLFEQAKMRYRSVMGGVDYAALDVAQLADLTATIFLGEATDFRKPSLASLHVCIQSRRDPALRAGLWAINVEQYHRWSQVLGTVIAGTTPFNAWVMYATFMGKLVRILATAPQTQTLAKVCSEFAYDLEALAQRRHWSNA
jgi:DNA-binding transcriptional regulator YbjK